MIYAPKREVVEIWPMRVGKKVRTFRCGGNCSLLQPSVRASGALQKQHLDGSLAALTTCFLLNGTTGELWDIAERLLAQ